MSRIKPKPISPLLKTVGCDVCIYTCAAMYLSAPFFDECFVAAAMWHIICKGWHPRTYTLCHRICFTFYIDLTRPQCPKAISQPMQCIKIKCDLNRTQHHVKQISPIWQHVVNSKITQKRRIKANIRIFSNFRKRYNVASKIQYVRKNGLRHNSQVSCHHHGPGWNCYALIIAHIGNITCRQPKIHGDTQRSMMKSKLCPEYSWSRQRQHLHVLHK